MKKKVKKLELSKETVKSLETDELGNAAGAACAGNSDTYRYCPREITRADGC